MELFKELNLNGLIPKLPIVQGGMGVGISLSGLAAAVAAEGGIGVISTAGIGLLANREPVTIEMEDEMIKQEIKKAREKTDGIIGVNIMVALTNFASLVKSSIEEKIDVIFSGAGLPLDLPSLKPEDSNTKLVPIISSARALKIICQKWWNNYKYLPDAVVVEGPLAGGHLGFKYEQVRDPEFVLEKLIPPILEELKRWETEYGRKIPLIAGGGIYYGSDMKQIFDMGVDGIQMGTRFVTTIECDASEEFKKAYLNAKEEDIIIIKSPVGLPGRAIKNKFLEDVEQGKRKPFICPYHCIRTCDVKNSPYCIAIALTNAMKGNLNGGFAFAGQNAFKTDKIISVKQLFHDLIEEYKASLNPV